jgi:subtilisin family serine protease
MIRTLGAVACGVLLALVLPAVPVRADQTRDQQWVLPFLETDDLHRISKGEGVTVAIVSDGVDADHPDLRGNVTQAIDRRERGWSRGARHGTALAGLVAGHGHGPDRSAGILGITPKAKILPVRVDTYRGAAPGGDNGNGIEAAVDKGADVVLVGDSGPVGPATSTSLDYAVAHDVLVVMPVGDRDRMVWWAPYSTVVTVAGVDRQGEVSRVSARGRDDIPDQISIAAPSDEVISTAPDGGYRTSTSTSNAAALVAGVAASIRSANPELDAADVRQVLVDSAFDRGAPGVDNRYGAGVVDPQRAVLEAQVFRPGDARRAYERSSATEPPATSWTDSYSESTLILLSVVRAVLMIVLYIVAPGVVVMRLARRWRRRAARDPARIPVRVAAGRIGRSDRPGYERWPQFRFLVMWSSVLGVVMVTVGALAGFVPEVLARRLLDERFDIRPPASLVPADGEVDR